jgi:hypothetical protein
MSITPAVNDKTLETFSSVLSYGEGVGLQMSGVGMMKFIVLWPVSVTPVTKLNSNVVDTGDYSVHLHLAFTEPHLQIFKEICTNICN